MRIAVLPSGQPNSMSGGSYEGRWAEQAAVGAARVFTAAGHEVRVFAEYDANGDLVEIKRQVKAMNAWGPERFLSMHIDATSNTAPAGILILYSQRFPANLAWGVNLGKAAAKRLGLQYKDCWDDSQPRVNGPFIIFNGAAAAHGLILECGNMQSPAQSAWLKANAEWIGEQEALAFLESLGLSLPQEAENMAIDTVSDATVEPELARLVAAGVIRNPSKEEHPWEDAASVGLLFTMMGRMQAEIDVLQAAPPK